VIRIGLLSDTHGYFDPSLPGIFRGCNEIWHAGDIGHLSVVEELRAIKPFRGVFGNIDDLVMRSILPEKLRFTCEGTDVFLTHITGYPGRYNPLIRDMLKTHPPGLLIGGHSHILKVIPDKKHNLLFVNPGAAGKAGLHQVRTVIRFCMEEGKVTNLEVIELGKR
jgi:putative phosphoesterase